METLILAAGLGTRLKPVTNSIPKALVEVNGVTLLEHVIKNLAANGTDRFVINIHHFGGQIIEFLQKKNNFNLDIIISDERNLLLDTGGGLKKAIPFFNDENFLIHNVDILSGIEITSLMNFHTQSNCAATLAVQKRNSSRYFLFDENKILCGWENVKTGEKKVVRNPIGNLTRFAFSGIHAVSKILSRYMPGKEVFSIVDLYLTIAESHQITYFDHTDTLFLDLGNIDNLEKAKTLLKNIK